MTRAWSEKKSQQWNNQNCQTRLKRHMTSCEHTSSPSSGEKQKNKNKSEKSLLQMFLGASASKCVESCKCEDLICALSKLAFSLNLGTSICCLMAGLQMQRNEQRFNLRWLGMVQWRCREEAEMKRLVSIPLVWSPGPQVSCAPALFCLRNQGTSWHFLHLCVFHLEYIRAVLQSVCLLEHQHTAPCQTINM